MLFLRALDSIAVLPGTALVIVPGTLLWGSSGTVWMADPGATSALGVIFGAVCGLLGLALAGWTIIDFARSGKGTLAPWDPPVNLLVTGPYTHVRNPVITGIALLLVAEALLLHSLLITAWAVFFFLINTAYIPKKEEPGLVRKFGDQYEIYRENVPRWLPRLTPWRPPPDMRS